MKGWIAVRDAIFFNFDIAIARLDHPLSFGNNDVSLK